MLFPGGGGGGGWTSWAVKLTKERLEGAYNRVCQRWRLIESQKGWIIDATRCDVVRAKVREGKAARFVYAGRDCDSGIVLARVERGGLAAKF